MYRELVQTFAARGESLEIIDERGGRHGNAGPCRFSLRILDPGFYRCLPRLDSCSIGEAYVRGQFEVNAMVEFIEVLDDLVTEAARVPLLPRLRFLARLYLFAGKKILQG